MNTMEKNEKMDIDNFDKVELMMGMELGKARKEIEPLDISKEQKRILNAMIDYNSSQLGAMFEFITFANKNRQFRQFFAPAMDDLFAAYNHCADMVNHAIHLARG